MTDLPPDVEVEAEVEAEGSRPVDEVPPVDVLPPAVRRRVLELAADGLARLPADEVPPPLRAVARFTVARRARLGAVPLARALDSDALLRQRLTEVLGAAVGGVLEGVDQPGGAALAEPVELAAAAFLLRPPRWPALLASACDAVLREQERQEPAGAEEVDRLREALDRARDQARTEVGRLRADLASARADADREQRRLRDELATARRAAERAEQEARAAQAERDAATRAAAEADAEARRARGRAEDARHALEALRSARREGRGEEDARLRVLLDALLGAAQGLRRELALAPVEGRPADAVAAALAPAADHPAPAAPGPRSLAADDPDALALLLDVPTVHLVVDGYNVTMSAYGDLPLQAQRGRLLGGLAALAARTGAEVTCVFDGVTRATPLAVAAPRGVRLLFSPTGTTADEVVRRLVRAEPPGRPLVVVSSDREVADGVAAAGARAVPAAALVRLLERS